MVELNQFEAEALRRAACDCRGGLIFGALKAMASVVEKGLVRHVDDGDRAYWTATSAGKMWLFEEYRMRYLERP